ncbi:MAG: LysM peptidoglycan-binding domain-containing protein [Acidimicrobiales bacterium]|jgi:nucleoid-associated protein YgaU
MVAIEFTAEASPRGQARPTGTALRPEGTDAGGEARGTKARRRATRGNRRAHSYFWRRYFWRRLLLLALVAGAGAMASSAAERLMASASPSRAGSPSCAQTSAGGCLPTTYVARPGDTIWAIAVRYSGDGDPRPLEYRLEQEIGGGTLQPGDVLRVP